MRREFILGDCSQILSDCTIRQQITVYPNEFMHPYFIREMCWILTNVTTDFHSNKPPGPVVRFDETS